MPCELLHDLHHELVRDELAPQRGPVLDRLELPAPKQHVLLPPLEDLGVLHAADNLHIGIQSYLWIS